jgi:allophanate hydrolase subunit 1
VTQPYNPPMTVTSGNSTSSAYTTTVPSGWTIIGSNNAFPKPETLEPHYGAAPRESHKVEEVNLERSIKLEDD